MHCCSINARKTVIWFTNGLFLNCGSAYEDLKDVVTILDLSGLLLHRLFFAHIYKDSGNQYFLLFFFAFLVLILLCFGYTRDFRTKVLPLCKICRYSFSLLNCFQHSLWWQNIFFAFLSLWFYLLLAIGILILNILKFSIFLQVAYLLSNWKFHFAHYM